MPLPSNRPCITIARIMLRNHFYHLFDSWTDRRPMPCDLVDFDELIEAMKVSAEWEGDLELLKRAMEAVLRDEQCDIERLAQIQTAYVEGKVREVVQYAYHKLWPDSPPEKGNDRIPVEFAEMTGPEWKRFKSEMRTLFSAAPKH